VENPEAEERGRGFETRAGLKTAKYTVPFIYKKKPILYSFEYDWIGVYCSFGPAIRLPDKTCENKQTHKNHNRMYLNRMLATVWFSAEQIYKIDFIFGYRDPETSSGGRIF